VTIPIYHIGSSFRGQVRLTGKLIWETTIDPELDRMLLVNVSATELALVGTGLKIVNRAIGRSDPPSIRIVLKDSGSVSHTYKMDNSSQVEAFGSTRDKFVLVTPAQLMFFTKDLKPVAVVEATKEYGDFVGIVKSADTLIVRATKGLAAISCDSYTEVWFKYCEVVAPEGEFLPNYEKNRIRNLSFFRYDCYWTPNERGGLTGFDLTTGKDVYSLDLGGTHTVRHGKDCIIDYSDNTIRVLTLH
jgi:hypothetical protein